MIRALSTWLVLGFAGAGLICGCGSSATSTTTVSAAGAAAATGAAGAAVAATGPASAAGANGSASASSGQAAGSATSTEASAGSASGHVWNAIQCGAGLRQLIKSNGASTAAQLRAYKHTLRQAARLLHLSVAHPHAEDVGQHLGRRQCGAALDQYVKSTKPSAAGLRAYKLTLRSQHGCFTSASLIPEGKPAKAKHHG